MNSNSYEEYAKECLGFLQDLIRTRSVNGVDDEAAVASRIIQEAESLGLPYEVHEAEEGRPNVFVGDDFSGSEELLLVAHSDTVPAKESSWTYAPFEAKIHDGKVYGRGAIDCKGGIAVSLYVMKILRDAKDMGGVKFVAGADEESGADSDIGVKSLLEEGLDAKLAVYTYGGGSKEALTIGHRGVIRVQATYEGESAHSGSKDWQQGKKGANAIQGLNDFLAEVEDYSYSEDNEYFPGYGLCLTPTVISGGVKESVVPESATVCLDIRTLPDHNHNKIIGDLQDIAERVTGDRISFKFKVLTDVPGALSDPTHDAVQTTKEVMHDVYGVSDPRLKGSGPANESYMFIQEGIPTVTGFGPDGEGFHAVDEHAEVASLKRSLEFLTRLGKSI